MEIAFPPSPASPPPPMQEEGRGEHCRQHALRELGNATELGTYTYRASIWLHAALNHANERCGCLTAPAGSSMSAMRKAGPPWTCVACQKKHAPEDCEGRTGYGRKCGDCCQCPAHRARERRKRKGPGCGGRSQVARADRASRERAYPEVKQTAQKLQDVMTEEESRHMNIQSFSNMRKAVCEAARTLHVSKHRTDQEVTDVMETMLRALPEEQLTRLQRRLGLTEEQETRKRRDWGWEDAAPWRTTPAAGRPSSVKAARDRNADAPWRRQRGSSGTVTWTSPLLPPSEPMALSDMSSDLGETIWRGWTDLPIQWPYYGSLSETFRFQPGGRFPWKKDEGRPCSHRERPKGTCPVVEVQRSNFESLRRFVEKQQNVTGPKAAAVDPGAAVNNLLQFLTARRRLAQRILSISKEAPPLLGNPGRWLCLELGPNNFPPTSKTLITGYHASSMYCLYRSFVRGMENGMAAIGKKGSFPGYVGVYNHAPERVHLCAGYLLHTPLAPDGFFFAPLFELEYPEPKPERKHVIPRSGKDNNQWLAYEDACHLRRVWINIWHVSEALTGTRDTKMSVEGHFWPELELDPDDDREIMQKRSHDLREHEP